MDGIVGKGVKSSTEPDQSSASEATSDILSSGRSFLEPEKTRLLALEEGRWSACVKSTGDFSLCGESEACGTCGSWEEENGRARGAELLSEKKATHERRVVRLMFSQ